MTALTSSVFHDHWNDFLFASSVLRIVNSGTLTTNSEPMELTTYQKFVMKELETSKKILLKKLDIIHE